MNSPSNSSTAPSGAATTAAPQTIDFTSFLKLMAHQRASDLFITAGMPPAIKVNGKISPITQTTLSPQQSRDLVLNVMTPAQREEFEKTHECNFAIGLSGVGRFRVSCFYQRNQVGMVLRRIETRIPTVDELSLPPIIKTLAMTKRGIILFVGATGTGKSTSLAAMIGHRNHNSTGHIITIEDPIEYLHKHKMSIVNQREVGLDTHAFHNALKNAMREAPDVILIGEILDAETMEAAIAFAETGHLCLATLHSNNADQTIERILNFFPESAHRNVLMNLSLNLRAVVSQRLVKGMDGRRLPATEVLINTPMIRDLLRRGQVHEIKAAMEASLEEGMESFDQCLFRMAKDGTIDVEEALRAADSRDGLALKFRLSEGSSGEHDPYADFSGDQTSITHGF